MGLRVYEIIVMALRAVGDRNASDAFEVVRFLAFYLCPPFSLTAAALQLEGVSLTFFPFFSLLFLTYIYFIANYSEATSFSM